MSAQPDNRSAATFGRPGDVISGRYTLLSQVGSDQAVHAAFWQARDTVLQRDVGLTLLLRTGDPGEAIRATEMIDKAQRWGGFTDPGAARLLDVMRRETGSLPEDVLGLAVTAWVPGRSLAEVAAGPPLRTTAALTTLDSLAQAAEAAHRQGLVLGCGHPQRIRVTPEGAARLAFALPNPLVTPADDVRGLGATLYTLLTAHWPLSGTDAELAGLSAAPRDVQDVIVPPGILRPGVSLEVSALALGALGAGAPHGRVHTAAAVHKVIGELQAGEQEAAMLPPPDDGAAMGRDEVWGDQRPAPRDDADRRRKVTIGMAALGGAVVLVLIYVLFQVGTLLGVGPSSPPPIVLSTPAPAPGPGVAAGGGASGGAAGAPADPATSAVVQPASASVFDPTGDPDNTGRVARAVDDDPRSSWRTYVYQRPFPALKPGVGLMISFATPVQLSQLTISSPSVGSKIEVRSAPGPDSTLAQTVLMANAEVSGEQTTVPMAGSQPVQNVLLWITELGGSDDENVTEISDIRFERAVG